MCFRRLFARNSQSLLCGYNLVKRIWLLVLLKILLKAFKGLWLLNCLVVFVKFACLLLNWVKFTALRRFFVKLGKL